MKTRRPGENSQYQEFTGETERVNHAAKIAFKEKFRTKTITCTTPCETVCN